MDAEEAVEIDGRSFARSGSRNGDRRPRVVIRLFAVRHYNVETIHSAALKNSDQYFLAFCGRRVGHLHEHVWQQPAGNQREARRFEKKSSIDHWRWNSGPPKSRSIFFGSVTLAWTPGN